MNEKIFPQVKNVIKKRTKNGQRYLVHGKDLAGKDVYVTIPIDDNDSESEYLVKVEAARIKLNEKILGGSFSAILHQYFEFKQYSKSTRESSRFLARFCMSNKKNKMLVKEILDSPDLKQSTKSGYLQKINGFFRWLENNKHINIDNPLNEINVQRKFIQSRRTRLITDSEKQRLFKLFSKEKDLEFALFVRIAYFTGARISSIFALKPESLYQGKIYYNNVKCRKDYDYAIPLKDAETLQMFNIVAQKGFLWSHSLSAFRTKIDMQMRKEFGRDVRGETLSIHSLRHSFASRAIQNGVPPEIVARLLDHSSINTTLTYYARHSQQQIDDAVSKIFK